MKYLIFILLILFQVSNIFCKSNVFQQIKNKTRERQQVLMLIQSQSLEIQKLIQIESSGNPKAKSRVNARGLMQIMNPVLIEYNERHRTQYTRNDLYCPKINIKIGGWYWNTRIPQMLKYFKLPTTTKNKIICYNFGIGNCLKYVKGKINLPLETKNYFKKFNSLKI